MRREGRGMGLCMDEKVWIRGERDGKYRKEQRGIGVGLGGQGRG